MHAHVVSTNAGNSKNTLSHPSTVIGAYAAQGRVVSGHLTALKVAAELATARGAMKASLLAVSGAFHTDLMQPARAALEQALAQVQRLPCLGDYIDTGFAVTRAPKKTFRAPETKVYSKIQHSFYRCLAVPTRQLL